MIKGRKKKDQPEFKTRFLVAVCSLLLSVGREERGGVEGMGGEESGTKTHTTPGEKCREGFGVETDQDRRRRRGNRT